MWSLFLPVLLFPADDKAEPPSLPLQQALRKATVDGKYAMLLRQIKVPHDAAKYQDFRDLGPRTLKQYAGFSDLPAGHWVYVYPYWYIWRDLRAAPKAKRPWGPEQATGRLDLLGPASDVYSLGATLYTLLTAWASLTPDGQDEWLLLEYAEPIVPAAILIHETFNPGAVQRITAFRLDGEEVEVWKGQDPTPVGAGRGVSEIPVHLQFKTNRVRLYLASRAVAGWNEIDAVGLREPSGKVHWAASADASSTYAEPQGKP